MHSFIQRIAVGAALVGLSVSTPLAAQISDQWYGTWKLNAAQSKFSPGPGPKSITVTFAKAGAGLKVTATTVAQDGKQTTMEYTAPLDGTDVAVTGSPDYDAVSVKMINPTTRHLVRKKGGKEVQTLHSVLSKDGKHYSTTTTGVNAAGQQVYSTLLFDKQ